MSKTETGGSTVNPTEYLKGRKFRLLIGGELCEAENGGTRETFDPSTGQVLTKVPEATKGDVGRAVEAAERAQPAWNALGVRERWAYFNKLAEAIVKHREDLALLDAIDCGNPVKAMRFDVDISVRNVLDWPAYALTLTGEVVQEPWPGKGNLHYTIYQPYGVVGKIVAFNHPVMFAMTRILPCLITGNTVVLKPGVQTPLSALAFGEIANEILPPGVLNVVSGGAETGDAIVTHPKVPRIGFTGSVPTGLLIQQRAATAGVKHVSLELGGKNAMMVFPDADVAKVVQNVRKGMNLEVCQGQSCGSTSRVFVHKDLYKQFVEQFAATVKGIKVGPAYEENAGMGPLVSKEHYERVTSYVKAGKEQGAKLVAGGERPAGLKDGYFLEPTVFADVDMGMRIGKEEIFGPVVSVIPWDNYDNLIQQVNAVEYGLTASIWTDNIHVAHKTAEKVEAGYVWINDSAVHYWGTPFGGWKNSGLGREESLGELKEYLQPKAVHTILRDPHDCLGGLGHKH